MEGQSLISPDILASYAADAAREVSGVRGLYRYGPTTLHVSPGLGTTFAPFRFFARPEVTELVLRSG